MPNRIGSILIMGAGIALGATAAQFATAGAEASRVPCPAATAGATAGASGGSAATSSSAASGERARAHPLAGNGSGSAGASAGNTPGIDTHGGATLEHSGSATNSSMHASTTGATNGSTSSTSSLGSTGSTGAGDGALLTLDANAGAQGSTPGSSASGSGGAHVEVPRPHVPTLEIDGGVSAGG